MQCKNWWQIDRSTIVGVTNPFLEWVEVILEGSPWCNSPVFEGASWFFRVFICAKYSIIIVVFHMLSGMFLFVFLMIMFESLKLSYYWHILFAYVFLIRNMFPICDTSICPNFFLVKVCDLAWANPDSLSCSMCFGEFVAKSPVSTQVLPQMLAGWTW